MVVQCPNCQSKFRIADEKVTDRGVRVRCTSCKNVFQVKKPGSAGSDPGPGPGDTMEISALDAAAAQKPRTGPVGTRPITKPVAPSSSPRPATGPVRPGATSRPAQRSGDGAARRLDADDLFGMAELTGDAPLGDIAPSSQPPPPPPRTPSPPPAEKPASKAMPDFDALDLDLPPEAPPPPPPPPAAKASPPAPRAPPPEEKAAPQKETLELSSDPFEGMGLGDPAGAGSALGPPAAPKKEPASKPVTKPVTKPQVRPEPPPTAGGEMVSSALSGLLGAALAIAVVIAAALNDDDAAGWLGFGSAGEIVATRVASGLYDTVAGKPVFFVRGRIENRSQRVRGPVRIVAELVAESGAEAKAEALAGAEPSPETVWSLRNSADADRMARALEAAEVERKLQPGGSLPFFAVIPDPPADLGRHKLHVRVEPVDAWNPPPPAKAQKDGRR